MENITTPMTLGYQSTARAASCRATGASWSVRGRHAGLAAPSLVIAATDAVMTNAVVKGAFPGPDAWSPPRD